MSLLSDYLSGTNSTTSVTSPENQELRATGGNELVLILTLEPLITTIKRRAMRRPKIFCNSSLEMHRQTETHLLASKTVLLLHRRASQDSQRCAPRRADLAALPKASAPATYEVLFFRQYHLLSR
jgi:hypothetical protein